MINPELIKEVAAKVDQEYGWDEVERDYDTHIENEHDSFGGFNLTTHSEPEDAIWHRDLSNNFYEGIKVGVRNTMKVLKENPDLLERLINVDE